MDLSDLTIFYTVGGFDVHYDNMFRSIKSIKDSGANPKFLVLEFGNKLSTNEEYEVLNLPDAIDFNSGKKVGYLIWKHKYVGALHIKTKYGMYVDSDTAMARNNLSDLLTVIGDGIGVTQHFWVPTIGYYQQRAVDKEHLPEFLKVKEMLSLEDDHPFFAGGVFLFANNEANMRVFNKVLEYYEQYYSSGKDYVRTITDELFLAAALKEYAGNLTVFNGALNHCSMGENYMPMMLHEEMLIGRNPFEKTWAPITFLHCDVSRRDPSESYEGTMKDMVRKAFQLDE